MSDVQLDERFALNTCEQSLRLVPLLVADHDGIDGHAQTILDRASGLVDGVGVNGTDNEQVDVAWELAGFAAVAPRPGPEDVCAPDTVYGCERLLQQRRGPERLAEQRVEFVVDRRCLVRPDDARFPDTLGPDDPGALETRDLALNGPWIRAEAPCELGERLTSRRDEKGPRQEPGLEPGAEEREQWWRYRAYNARYLALGAIVRQG